VTRLPGVVCLLLAFVTGGCAGFYAEPDLPADQVARVVLHTIDGQLPPVSNRATLRPGQHVFSATYATLSSQGQPIRFTFEAEAGHKYVIRGRSLGGAWQGWIVDETTGRVVAGRPD
jgi:hypothetical protein